jgi:hypothetical protein
MRKTHAILQTKLDEARQAQLADWLIGGMKYHEAVPVIEKEFGLKLGGGWKRQLGDFWQSVCVPQLLRRRHQAVTTSEEIATEAKSRPGQFDAATIDALKQKSFELSINPGANPKDVKALFSLVLKAREQDEHAQDREHDLKKWQAAQKTKIEAGLDALFEEVKHNAEARDLFQRFKAAVTQATA